MSSTGGKPSSRSQVLCPILEKPNNLKRKVLLTIEDLLKYYFNRKHKSNNEKPIGLISKI